MVKYYIPKNQLPDLTNEYVCWLDLMGTKSLMDRSPTTCTIKISQFHLCLSSSKIDGIKLYPVMDGAFITTRSQNSLKSFLRTVFESMSNDFITEGEKNNHLYQSIIRACIAYGPLGHGSNIQSDKIPVEYKNSLLFGLPMTQAYSSENKAPPFGIYVDKSARAFSSSGEKPFSTRWHTWFDTTYNPEKLIIEMNKFYDWAKEMSFCLPYDEDNISLHQKISQQYLNYYKINPTKNSAEGN
ncbi:hypothetical protein [Legionella genomosp. 1]|uniref:hypothetical protein n=1 Tax=Legionella genomosp. 1 TaxID=1093625 RepID=UPI001054B8F5|nr:hypothetical protein [Legionella genomosp. 1]